MSNNNKAPITPSNFFENPNREDHNAFEKIDIQLVLSTKCVLN